MDGLTISSANSLLKSGETLSEIRDSKFNVPQPSLNEKSEKSFADTLKDAVKSVNQIQQTADQKMQDLAVGKSHDIAGVMLASEKADIALKLMVQVRNKIIEAYQDIMKMQV